MARVMGIGIDSVDIEELGRLLADTAGALAAHTFTEGERSQARGRSDEVSCLAGKFAVKEAAFKALSAFAPAEFDMRRIEVIDDAAGAPHVTIEGAVADVLRAAGATELLVSITNEKGVATAVVLAQ